MQLTDKKMAVLQVLAREGDWISVNQITRQLPENYPLRTIRRWLGVMVEEGLLQKKGKKRGVLYRINPAENYPTQRFSQESVNIIEQVRRPLFDRKPAAYKAEWFSAYQPNYTFYFPLNQRMSLLKAGKRGEFPESAGSYAHQIFNRLLIDLSYNSSRLEGNTYSLLDTERLVLKGTSAVGKLDQETIMILNHKEAIRYLVDTASKQNLSIENIRTLHYLLAEGLVDTGFAGKVRNQGVRVSGSTYVPYEDPSRLENQFEKIIKKAALIQDPYEQSLFLLVHISYLQYFIDVNKRTARLSANIPLIKANLVPLSFNDVERDDYSSAMIAIYELQDPRPLIDLYAYSYMRTCLMYDATVTAIGLDVTRVRYRQQRRALIGEIILKNIIKNDIETFVIHQSRELIPENDRELFIEDVLEDIKEIDLARIVGLGVTAEQFLQWVKIK